MRVVWAPQALDDRDAIWAYLAADNPSAAIRVDAELGDGARELFPIHDYRIVYELSGEEVQILAIVHTSRRWPSR